MRKTLLVVSVMLALSAGLLAKEDELDSVAYINDFSGECELKKKGEDIGEAVRDILLPLYEGDTVITDNGSSMEIVFDDSTIVKLDSKSRLTIKTLKRKTTVQTFVELVKGRLFAVVNKLKPQEEFKVQTKMAWAAVKGTEFAVEADEDEKVGVYEGEVVVTSYDMSGNERGKIILDKDKETVITKKLKKPEKAAKLSNNFVRRYKEIKDIRQKIEYMRNMRRSGKAREYKLERKLDRIKNLRAMTTQPGAGRKLTGEQKELVNEIIAREAYYQAQLDDIRSKERKTKQRIKKYMEDKKENKDTQE